MQPLLITSGIAYAQFVDELRTLIRTELRHLHPTHAQKAEVGGMELAQEVTRLSRPRLYSLTSTRQIPHSKRGNRLYFNRADLQAWVAAGQR
jgi:hypothetical protein